MGPGADHGPFRPLQGGHKAQQGIAVAVGPAADAEHRRPDGAIVFGHRTRPPEGVAALMAQPARQRTAGFAQPLQPHGTPALAHRHRVGPARDAGKDAGAPADAVVQQAAPHVMDVVAIAVVAGTAHHDGLQRRRAPGGHLQGGETAPGDADHGGGAVAPGLAGDPGQRLADVVLLAGQVFVQQQAVGIAGPGDIQADGGIAVAGPPGVVAGVAGDGAVQAAIGDGFHDGRHRGGVGGQPHARRQPPAVGHGDPQGAELAHRAARSGAFRHGGDARPPRRPRPAPAWAP